jgi:subtilisin family serine protease
MKLDKELQIIYSNYLEILEKGKQNVDWIHPAIEQGYKLSVFMDFSGDIKKIESLGFETAGMESETEALGDIDLKDLEQIAASNQVEYFRFGSEMRMELSTSVGEINVRGTGNIWEVKADKKGFDDKTGTGTVYTGKGVVIGIIDSGIDFNHPVFFETETPKKKTRIKRIWDQGLRPKDGEKAPDKARFGKAHTYGVEYKDKHINDVLQKKSGAKPVRHKDCNGHGTHVAAIAAGDGRAAVPKKKNSTYRHIGVAPQADIIVVKIMHLIKSPKKDNDDKKTTVGFYERLMDAINYIVNVADKDLANKPVSINYSAGGGGGPADGLTDIEKKIRERFEGEKGKGKIFVKSAGNKGTDKPGKEAYGLVTLPNDGKVTLTFEVYDKRTKKTSYDKCDEKDDTKNIDLDIWYKDISPNTVEARLKVEGESTFKPKLVIGPPQSGSLGSGKTYKFQHRQEVGKRPATSTHAAMDVKRNNISLKLIPNCGKHRTGKYEVELKGPKDTEFHVWCDIMYKYGLKFLSASPAGALKIKTGADQEHLITVPGGATNILTVAAYDDADGKLAYFSSRGPLTDYSSAGKAYTDKPDIAAPGWKIFSAHSNYTRPPGKSPCCKKTSPADYKKKSGTSMSAPHVTGVAALMLQKNKDLKAEKIVELIRTHIRPGTPPDKDTFGAGKLNGIKALKNVT